MFNVSLFKKLMNTVYSYEISSTTHVKLFQFPSVWNRIHCVQISSLRPEYIPHIAMITYHVGIRELALCIGPRLYEIWLNGSESIFYGENHMLVKVGIGSALSNGVYRLRMALKSKMRATKPHGRTFYGRAFIE